MKTKVPDTLSFRWRLIIWIAVSLAVAIIPFLDFWATLPALLQPDELRRQGLYGWGSLGVCLFWAFLKRDIIYTHMKASRTNIFYIAAGLALLVAVLLVPSASPFSTAFRILAAVLALFAVPFGRAAIIPAPIVAIYGFTLVFPLLLTPLAEGPWGQTTLTMVVVFSRLIGLPLSNQGALVSVEGPSGETISSLVSSECAGQITMGLFLALFALMMIDIPLPWRRALVLLLLGILGTTLQNLIRIEAILIASHQWGWLGFNMGHRYSAWITFPLWYALFAYLYFRVYRHRCAPPQTHLSPPPLA